MAASPLSGVVQYLRKVALVQDDVRRTDGQLLELFLTRRDEAAFEALLQRHGPMVLGVCRRLLHDCHDAEDAFQATFLLFVRKAAAIRQRESVAAWLCRAAFRAALEVQELRRRSREKQVNVMPEPEAPLPRDVWSDLRPLLDQELDRLPDKYREAVILCDLEGKTRKEAARELGVPEGTLSGRLTIARRMLAKRLAQRGLTISGGMLAALLSESAASACLPKGLVLSATRAATCLLAGAGVSGKAAAIVTGVLKTMLLRKLRIASALLVVVAVTAGGVAYVTTLPGAAQPAALPSSGKQELGVFAGSSPCDDSIRPLLQVPADADAHLIQWKLTLYRDSRTQAPAGYELHGKYGLTVPGQPGLDKTAKTLERQGRWTIAKGTKSDPGAVVYELDGTVALVKIDQHILHVLNRDRSLMVGGGGWSYTLYSTAASEKPVDPSSEAAKPSESYTLAPIATGPSVFGIFGGRSPCRGIARALKISGVEGCARIKWRVTLFQDPDTRAPTTYKVENSLRPKEAREGNWTILRGTDADAKAMVFRLDATRTEPALFLQKGDDNVLFFLDQDRKPLVGHADFSYTLNRRMEPPSTGKPKPEE